MSGKKELSSADYVEGIRNGHRVMLARAITLVESSRDEHRGKALEIIDRCLPFSGGGVRIGVTGVPGAGKSTFVEALGVRLLEQGRRIAVLAVDPTSAISGGSILGDKTRMPKLSISSDAFVRPSPSRGAFGGVAPRTREVVVLCEAAGYDTIFIETVGVGQAETSVHSMVDFFLVLSLAGAGDELQGIKRGIVELADTIAITKADGNNIDAAKRAQSHLVQALKLFPPSESGWRPRVHTCSALTGEGLDRVWETVSEYVRFTRSSGYFESRRKGQLKSWMAESFDSLVQARLREDPTFEQNRKRMEARVAAGEISASSAAEELFAALFRS